jgi:hypothetical protein
MLKSTWGALFSKESKEEEGNASAGQDAPQTANLQEPVQSAI